MTTAEYIEREALIAEFKRLTLGENSLIERVFADGVYAVLETFPAADVVEVVRCGKCKHWDKGELYCHHPAGMTFYGKKCANEGFCYFGERRCEDEP